MSSPLVWKVYGPLVPRSNPHAGKHREYLAACADAESAAALVSLRGDGAIVKHAAGFTVWREGQEEFSAGNSYDGAAGIMWERLSVEQHKRHQIELDRQAAYARARREAAQTV